MDNPKINIQEFQLADNGVSMGRKHWDLATILQASKDLPQYDLQLSAIDLNVQPWNFNSIDGFIYHAKRIENANFDHPIIQAPWGYIIDRWHRVAKAILEGRTTIKAVRLNVMPEPDKIDEGSN